MKTARALTWLVPALASAAAYAQTSSEAAVKAAFLVKFGAYVGWPPSAGPMRLCLVGRDVIGGMLDQAAAGERIDGRPVQVQRLDRVGRSSGCDIAYLAAGGQQSVPAMLAGLRGAPVLTVTDARWTSSRGMIHFQVAANRVRFHIDERAAVDSGLTISSKLLGLALSVRQRSGR